MSANTEIPKIVFTISATIACIVIVLSLAKMTIYIPSIDMVKKHGRTCPDGGVLTTTTSTGLFVPEFIATCSIVVSK